MAMQYSTTLRNAQLDVIETTIGTAPKLQLRTGAQPATCATADSGTLLAEITCPSDWLGAAGASTDGVKSLAGSWSVAATSTGTAAHFRIKNSAGTVTHIQGSVSATGGSGDLQLDNTSLVATQTVSITAWNITAGNA